MLPCFRMFGPRGEGAVALRDKVQRGVSGSFSGSGNAVILIADIADNLPFMQVYAVLNALHQLSCEGQFTCRGNLLGPLLKESKTALPRCL